MYCLNTRGQLILMSICLEIKTCNYLNTSHQLKKCEAIFNKTGCLQG